MGWDRAAKKPTDLRACERCGHPAVMVRQKFLGKKFVIHVSRLGWDALIESNSDTAWRIYKNAFLSLILKDKKEGICGYDGCKCKEAKLG